MEGKGVLFKKYADVDVFDIEIDEKNPEKLIQIIKSMEPTFGGINLEDIKAPECFEIERRLIDEMSIPVFHDDQHGTAIIATAGFLNAIELVDKKPGAVKVVFSGAGASALACAKMLEAFGVSAENIWICDSKGLVVSSRNKIEKYRARYAKDAKPQELCEVIKDADVFIGLSVAGIMKPEMVKAMANNPIIFAMANPDPEIMPEDVMAARKDAVIATGRSDYSNQVNNVLGFPFIFRGALDVGARKINEEMKKAAALALAGLAKEPVPAEICRAYRVDHLDFGRDYIIPKPLDPRVLTWEAPAVAMAAMKTGVAEIPIEDFDLYKKSLEIRMRRS
jgi:malate dehydrogenase (oxaloacetate-decarboxylating)(NADP+)